MQPKRFLPLTQEAKKLAEELCKEEIASQWAGLPPKKILQESFLEQLDALQALDQLASLTAAKEHLPGDIIDILAHLGKAVIQSCGELCRQILHKGHTDTYTSYEKQLL